MRSMIFDTGAIISLATNNLLWTLGPLSGQYEGEFYIPKGVKKELIDNPLKSLKFRLEAMQVLAEVAKGSLKIFNKNLDREKKKIDGIVNNMFWARGKPIKVAHEGEISVVALARFLKAEALVIDERTTRVLIEDPKSLAKLLGKRLHTHVEVDKDRVDQFREYTKKMRVIRSIELGMLAYELGFLDRYIVKGMEKYVGDHLKKKLLEGLLWGLKLRGCSISEAEITDLLKIEGFTPL